MSSSLVAQALAAAILAAASARHTGASMRPELANDRVKVVRVKIDAHGKIPMHAIPPHVTVWLTDAHMEITFPDGRREVHHARAGDVTWVAVGEHSGTNLGEKPIEFVAVEPAGEPGPGGAR